MKNSSNASNDLVGALDSHKQEACVNDWHDVIETCHKGIIIWQEPSALHHLNSLKAVLQDELQ